MQIKKTIVLTSAWIFSLSFMSFEILNSNGRAGATGSPGENTCNQSGCHSGNPLNDPAGSISISAPTLTGFQYVLGQTYAVSITVARVGVNLFGFGFEALTSTGANAGNLIITDAVTTTTKSLTVLGNSRKSVVHTFNGGATADSHTFTFNWTAPLTNVGNVTFYFAGNAANGNNITSGDFIYKSSQVVTPAPVGIEENHSTPFSLSVFPNPANESTTISYELPENGMVTTKLISLTGEILKVFNSAEETAGLHEQKVQLDPALAKGIYFLGIDLDGKKSFRRIVIN